MEIVADDNTNNKVDDPTAGAYDSGGQCGWCCWRPNLLQRFSTSKSFLFWVCWAAGFQSFVINGLLNVCVNTIERRYELTSTDTGIIIGCYDIASFLTVLPISYLGGRKGACKPKWVGYGVLLLGIGSFVFATPHFASGFYQASSTEEIITTCSLSKKVNNVTCSTSDNLLGVKDHQRLSLSRFKYVFLFAQLLMGIGGAPLYTLGTAFIDENVSHKMQPIYSGIYSGSTMFGLAVGYIAGGQLLRIYVDFDKMLDTERTSIAPGASAWVGAWWLGFVIAGTLLCVASIPLLAFPSELLGAKAVAAAKDAESQGNSSKTNADEGNNSENDTYPSTIENAVSISQSLREFPTAIKELATRWTFIFICLEQSCEALLLAGFGAFIAKIIESQFSVTPAMAAIIVGGLVIPCGCGASYLGGYLIKHYQMEPRAILKLSVLWVFLSFVASLGFMVSCPNHNFAGVTIPYNGQQEINLASSCNAKCSCPLDTYDPICGNDNVLYFSPCHAGCVFSHQISVNGSNSLTVFSDCSCISQQKSSRIKVSGGKEVDVVAARRACTSTECTYQLYLFTALFFLFLALVFLNSMPILSATLRSVPYNRRAFALGTQMIIWRLCGAIPGPIIFGLFIDRSCVLWSQSKSGCGGSQQDSGSCLVYDNYAFSRAMVIIALGVKALTLLFAILAWRFYKSASKTKSSREVNENRIRQAKENYAYDNTDVDQF